jgi:transcriptional regulator GlxA family with amidase domain
VARRLVVPPHRAGGQAQYVEQPVAAGEGASLERTRAWLLERLERSHTLDGIAAHAGMSRRTLVRHFRAETGTSPLQWLLHQRVLLARRLLEITDEPIARVGDRCGFGSPAAFRLHFTRAVATSPLAYRLAFRGGARGRAGASRRAG